MGRRTASRHEGTLDVGDIYPPRSIDRHSRPPDVSPRSPWQNTYAERLIGSIRRECLDHIVMFGERHMHHVLLSYMDCYNGTRTHLIVEQERTDITCRRGSGTLCRPILGGLHHQCAWA
jgi:hypothetical protein